MPFLLRAGRLSAAAALKAAVTAVGSLLAAAARLAAVTDKLFLLNSNL